MVSAESSFLSITPGLRCRDESGRIVLWARVHGGGYLYASIGLNGGCNILERSLVGHRVSVTVSSINFVAKVKARSRTTIGIAIPLRYRGLFNRGDVVEVRLRPIEGDGHG